MKKFLVPFVLLIVLALLAACAAPAPPAAAPAEGGEEAAAPAEGGEEAAAPAEGGEEQTFVTIVKIAGINWFNRMEEGVNQWGEDNGINASLVGPAEADAAQQIPIIEDLIAQGVDAICVVPMDPGQLDPVLQKAMDAGIVVITHEASNQLNMDWDIEAFDNKAFGAGLMDRLAAEMGEEGEYAVFVGSLGSKTHNEWVDGGIERQMEAYPNMVMVGDKNESFDDSQIAYEKAKEILKAYPNIKGFQGSASTDVAGIGQAVEEAGLQDTGGGRGHQPALHRRRPADHRRHRRHRLLGPGRGRSGLQQAGADGHRRRGDRRRHRPGHRGLQQPDRGRQRAVRRRPRLCGCGDRSRLSVLV